MNLSTNPSYQASLCHSAPDYLQRFLCSSKHTICSIVQPCGVLCGVTRQLCLIFDCSYNLIAVHKEVILGWKIPYFLQFQERANKSRLNRDILNICWVKVATTIIVHSNFNNVAFTIFGWGFLCRGHWKEYQGGGAKLILQVGQMKCKPLSMVDNALR